MRALFSTAEQDTLLLNLSKKGNILYELMSNLQIPG